MAGKMRGVRHLDADLTTVVLVCRKCAKKLKGGFGPDGDEKLTRSLRRALVRRGGKRKALRARSAVVEVDCLDLCPKNAIVTLRADRPGDWVLVSKGADIADVIDHLGLGGPASSEVV